jgi:hypothetical protein
VFLDDSGGYHPNQMSELATGMLAVAVTVAVAVAVAVTTVAVACCR